MTKLIVVFFIYSLTIQWATADNQKVAIASAHPLATAAGFEMGSGININTVIPEEAAKFLREIKTLP